jgi:hypothetical protein
MAWTTPSTWVAGAILTAAQLNTQLRDNMNELRANHADGIRRIMANQNTFNNQTSYADFPNATDKAAMDLTFVKASSATSLLVAVHASLSFDSGGSQIMSVGLSIGGTDYDVAQFAFPTAVSRQNFSGLRVITGVNAASLAVKPRFKAGGASAVNFYANADYVQYSVLEITA